MNPSLSASASTLLDFIASFESRGSYDVIFGNHQRGLPKKITAMTLDELQINQRRWASLYKSSAAGRYQIMSYTLAGLMKDLRLSGRELFDENMQDKLGYQLLRRRGFERFIAGALTIEQFGLQLAMEWASLPVLKAVKGAHLWLQRGQSYYCGDKLNRALVAPDRVEAVLHHAFGLHDQPVAVPTKPEIPMTAILPPVALPASHPVPSPKPWYLSKGIIGGLIAVASPLIAVATHGVIKPDPAGTTELVMKIIEVAGPIIGGALSVWGRATATQPIGSKAHAPQPLTLLAADLPQPVSLMSLPVGSIINELPEILSFLQSMNQMIGDPSARDIPAFIGGLAKPEEPEDATSHVEADEILPSDPQDLTVAHIQSLTDLATKMRDLAPILANIFPQGAGPRPKPASVAG